MNEPLRNTLLIVLLVELAVLPAATIAALLWRRTDLFAGRLVGGLCLPLFFLPLYLVATAWDAGFGLQGWWTYRGEGVTEPWLAGRRAVIWIHACAAFPGALLILGEALRQAPRAWEELAILEAGPWRVLAWVTLPRAAPGIAAAALWIAVTTAGEMVVTDMYLVRTNAEAIFQDLAAGATLGELAAASTGNFVVMAALAAGAAGTAWWASSPRERSERGEPWRWRLGGARVPAGAAVLAVVALLWSAPLYNLAHHAGTEVRVEEGRRTREWRAAKALRKLAGAPREFASEIRWSVEIGAAAALLATGATVPWAWRARRSKLAWRAGWIVAALALAAPGPLVSLGLLAIRDGTDWNWLVRLFDDSILMVAAAHAWRAFPYVWLLAVARFREFPLEACEAAATCGASPSRVFFSVVLPRRRGTLVALGLLAFGTSLAEVPIAHLVRPRGVTTVAVRAFELAHYGANDRLAALSLVTILAAVLLVGLGWFAARSEREDDGTTRPSAKAPTAASGIV